MLDRLQVSDQLCIPGGIPLDLDGLAINVEETSSAFIAAGTAASKIQRYRGALTYLSAWLQLRYGHALTAAPVSSSVAVQFAVDHLARPVADGHWIHLLPADVDAALVAARIKVRQGPLAYDTVNCRLKILGKWHRLNAWTDPTKTPVLKLLLREACNGLARQHPSTLPQAAILEPQQAMLATCNDDIHGVRDRALLLLAWSPAGYRAQVVDLQIRDVRPLAESQWLTALPERTHEADSSNSDALSKQAIEALKAWLAVAPAYEGPLFRRLYKGGKVGAGGLSANQLTRIIQRRARLAGLGSAWENLGLRLDSDQPSGIH